MKLKKDGTPRKAGSGRTKGAISLVSVKFSKLVERFTADDIVVVGAKFLEKSGITHDAPAISEPTPQEVKDGITVLTV